MKNYIVAILAILLMAYSCEINKSQKQQENIDWISQKGYSQDNVEQIKSRGRTPFPEIKTRIANESVWLKLDLSRPGFIIKENIMNFEDFAPTRIVSKTDKGNDLLLEEGYLDNVTVLGETYEKVVALLLKRSKKELKENGIVGTRYYNDKIITLDFDNKIIAYSDTGNKISRLGNSYSLDPVLKRNRNKNLAPYFSGKIDTIEVLMNIELDERYCQISSRMAKMLTDRNKEFIKLSGVEIGGLRIPKTKCKVTNLSSISPSKGRNIDFSVGLNVLRKFLLTVNLSQKEMFLEEFPDTTEQASKIDSITIH